MSGLPGKGHAPKPMELVTKDGRRVALKVPGLPQPIKPGRTEERGAQEPPRDDPRPPLNPHTSGF